MRARLVLPLFTIALAACGSDSTAPKPPDHFSTIAVTDTGFVPESLDVQTNTLITWSVTGGSLSHVIKFTGTVPSGGNPNSSTLVSGQSASTTFLQTGTYHYEDTLHTEFQGVVTVH
jgi:plastocyanin